MGGACFQLESLLGWRGKGAEGIDRRDEKDCGVEVGSAPLDTTTMSILMFPAFRRGCHGALTPN